MMFKTRPEKQYFHFRFCVLVFALWYSTSLVSVGDFGTQKRISRTKGLTEHAPFDEKLIVEGLKGETVEQHQQKWQHQDQPRVIKLHSYNLYNYPFDSLRCK